MAAASSTPMPRIPYENPNAISNMLEIWALLVIPFASVFAFGRAVLDFRQGRAIAIAMGIVLVAGVSVAYWAEVERQSVADGDRRRSVARQYGRQGSSLRSRHERALRHGDHGHQHRLRQLDA